MILIDNREKRSSVPKFLERLGVRFEFVELEIGDYVVGEVVIERKEVNDYLGSLISGRLSNQLYQLSYHYPLAILIVEGFVDEALYYRKIKRQTYLSSLAGAILKRAPDGERGIINLVMVTSTYDTAVFLKFLDEKYRKGEPRLPVIKSKKAFDDRERALAVLCSLPGISETRAERLLNYFGSLREFFSANEDDLTHVDGIGKKTAKTIVGLLDKNFKEGSL